ncbi:hypothetical protein LOK49_LG03G03467 [Camellia lanceoleosa]|uniref:Uncharacterized protein n=2 Tax=Camellia lanceoleosa TaxID=1840588 RepID=A0ACC0ICK8_9ERIC|nr:hypothetical protein LOK49_LG03G03467 [Camellia lanceoleosa]
MEGESRKRKVGKDEDEEEKMEKFFALIRSTRDVRKRMVITDMEEEKKKKKKGEEEKLPVGVWNPSFQPEDFMEGGGGSQASLAGPSKRQDETLEEDKGLDLKLSL